MSNVDIVRSGYEAFARQDIPALLSLFDDSVEWYSPDELPEGGTYRGPAGVDEFFAKLPTYYGELHGDPDRFYEVDDRVIVEGRQYGSVVGGAAFECGFAHFWTLRDGKVTAFREYSDTGRVLSLISPPLTAT
ncbi:hypothetical protein HDA32_004672 [Spinactinospora alkalitolerans]|uniref:SnoaL-like domain-containing protein n=1 Tax=Spinactinospora alkalitolerans TaxID=687207 RepID=A0A852U2B9_9ACTN|nr:nuclear transport factor 2 family protein [Spinactinospora alkalitolerans]NYE49552.1 hypothetical protein [Spinactinospora alkalitolerans]